jgi:hypothetical protein
MKKVSKPAPKKAASKPASKTPEKPARKPIYVSSTKDKRLLAYNDSLKTHNLSNKFKKDLKESTSKAKTSKEFQEARSASFGKFLKAGGNYELLRGTNKKLVNKGYGDYIMDWETKKPVQPVEYKKPSPVAARKKEEKTSIAPKQLKKPSPSIKVERTVKLPSGIRDVKYDTQKGTVLVNLDGTQKSMPRKDFDKWVNQPENRKMFNEYRSKKAKKK